jgi:hypothetical protein
MTTDASKALEMLTAFASVGARSFDVTVLNDIEGREENFQSNRSLEELRRSMAKRLEAATRLQHSVIIRPRSSTALLIQLDDFTAEKAAQIEPHSFLTLQTSPGNFQVWLAVSDGPKEADKEAAKEFKTRVRRGAGSDHSASGATRIAGSLNFKKKYAPAFPRVEITRANAGSFTTVAGLEHAGLLAPEEQPMPPASSAPQESARPAAGRYWPDYQQVLSGAPRKQDGTPDRSKADYFFCKFADERGFTVDEMAAKLPEVSPRARERIAKGDVNYCRIVAGNAHKYEEQRKSQRQFLKPTPQPRQ